MTKFRDKQRIDRLAFDMQEFPDVVAQLYLEQLVVSLRDDIEPLRKSLVAYATTARDAYLAADPTGKKIAAAIHFKEGAHDQDASRMMMTQLAGIELEGVHGTLPARQLVNIYSNLIKYRLNDLAKQSTSLLGNSAQR